MKIAIVEDDSYTRKLIKEFLEAEGYDVIEISSGYDALGIINRSSCDIIILDINLPGKSGMEICSAIRERPQIYGNPVILMLTGETGNENVRDGFKIGADDYIKKPFDIQEIIYRVKAWTKRTKNLFNVMKYKNIVLDVENMQAFIGEKEITLSVKEFEVIKLLIISKGLVVSRERIMEDVWDTPYYQGCKTIDMTIKRLKEKIPEIESDIVAVPGIGYRLAK